MLNDADGILELFRGALPYYVMLFVPILIILSPVNPVQAAHEFAVYRMQHYDLAGSSHGCRSTAVNLEARTLNSESYSRRCVLARLTDLTISKFQDIIQQGAGGVLVILPNNMSTFSEDQFQNLLELERSLLEEEVFIPVYFTHETPEITRIYDSIELSVNNAARTAAEELMGSVTANGFLMVISASQAKSQNDMHIYSIQGKLSGFGVEDQLPTIAIISHYDAYGVAPSLATGADSNGSGVAALLELARLFSRLYTSSRTHPRFNLLFLLSGAGKFNFHGSKKWIEDNLDGTEGSLLSEVQYTLCLDSLGNGDELFMHVSKPPKENSSAAILLDELQRVSQSRFSDLNVSMIHKKINLADEVFSWEHERFSIRRLPAFTLSRLQSPRANTRFSILDTKERVNIKKLARNVKVIGEALAHQIYDLNGSDKEIEIFTDSLSVQEEYLSSWVDYFSSQPRGAQILAGPPKHPLVMTLEMAMSRYLKEVKVSTYKPDKREPEIVFYSPYTAIMNAYNVKPAVFDLFLCLGIAAYLGIVYLIIKNFHLAEDFLRPLSTSGKLKSY